LFFAGKNIIVMMDEFDRPVRDIVKQDYRTADVFKKHQLGYCCSGNVPLKSACEARGIDYGLLSAELRESTKNVVISNFLPIDQWEIVFLIDYIVNVHHTYLYQVIPSLSASLESFAVGHQDKYPELTSVSEIFAELAGILMNHNRHEDEIIFPYIKQIDSAYRRKEPYGNLFVRTLRKPLYIVEREHQRIQELLNGLQTATNHFTPPESACLSYEVNFKKLEELYNNLIQHKHLEHDLLFPRAIAIEQKLLQF
jgi:regulator of cell morphogenesis and NO signaling